MGIENTSSKATSVIALNMAKEARDTTTKDNRTCSNRRSRKDK